MAITDRGRTGERSEPEFVARALSRQGGLDGRACEAYCAHRLRGRDDCVSEDPRPSGTPATPGNSGVNSNRQDLRLADATRLTETIVGHLTEQARSTANAAKAGRLTNGEDEPGVLDVTPLRELLAELVQELQKLRTRERVAWALRQAADIIDPQTPSH
jgi:hypothetical protein